MPGSRAWSPGTTRCRVERDGLAQDAEALRRQFNTGLDGAVAAGLKTLAENWQRLPGLVSAHLEAQLGVLTGQVSLTWGWHLGPGGLDGPALMRVLGRLALDACRADIQLGGEILAQDGQPAWLADTRTRVSLKFAGHCELHQSLQHESPMPPLAELLGGAVTRWRFPADITLEALATDAGRVLQQAGPVTGALVGEAGLRPRTTGGSGWEWFAAVRIEPVSVPLTITDPLLGNMGQTLSLLPAMNLLNWNLG